MTDDVSLPLPPESRAEVFSRRRHEMDESYLEYSRTPGYRESLTLACSSQLDEARGFRVGDVVR